MANRRPNVENWERGKGSGSRYLIERGKGSGSRYLIEEIGKGSFRSPQPDHTIGVKRRVHADDGDRLDRGLGDEQPVERISVVER